MGVNRNKVLGIFCMFAIEILFGNAIDAQTTYNPYSLFGIGELEYGEYGRNSGMAGVSIGIQNPDFLNTSNPASLGSLDSMTFLYDFAASAKWSTFYSNSDKEKSLNAGLKRVIMGFRISPLWSIGFGIVPYSSVGYKISSTQDIEGTDGKTASVSYNGSGGINKFFLTNAFVIKHKLSIGINTSFLIGTISNNESIYGWDIETTSSVRKINFDFGLQYADLFKNKIQYVVGFVYGYKSSFSLDNNLTITDEYGSLLKNESTGTEKQNLPMFYGIGISACLKNSLILAVDYQYQKTSVIKSNFPDVVFNDMHKFKFGAELKNNRNYYTNYFQKIRYQTGFSVGNSYLKINKINPINFGICAGLVLPIKNSAFVNFSVEVGKTGSSSSLNQIRENYTRLNLNITFKDLWFYKRRYD